MRVLVSEFSASDMSGKNAKIYSDGVIEFCREDLVLLTRDLSDYTMQYIEDAAENYVTGVMTLNCI